MFDRARPHFREIETKTNERILGTLMLREKIVHKAFTNTEDRKDHLRGIEGLEQARKYQRTIG